MLSGDELIFLLAENSKQTGSLQKSSTTNVTRVLLEGRVGRVFTAKYIVKHGEIEAARLGCLYKAVLF